jgi:hypothetical protein
MASDAVPELLDQMTVLPPNASAVDLLVVSQGGDPTVAWRALSLLRERFASVAVLVPQAAYSAATLLALGANEIVMHPHGNLGPVDPQITVKKKPPGSEQETEMRFGYEELVGFLQFARQDAGLSDQQHISSLLQFFCQEVGAVPVGIAARGSMLSVSMGEKLLRMHMTEEADVPKARGIAEALNKKFFHHGYPVSRSEAKEIGLRIADANTEVEETMWQIWLDVERELKTRTPFNPVVELMASAVGPQLTEPIPQVNLPPNLPAAILQQLLPSILSQVQVQVTPVPPVNYQLIHAVMESTRAASRCATEGKIFATRMPDLQLRINVVLTRTGWSATSLPEGQTESISKKKPAPLPKKKTEE